MNIEKLIEQLRTESLYADKASLEIMDLCMDAAQTLENLQIELKAMRGAANSYKAENARLESELEKLKAERDDAISFIEYLDHNYSGYLEDFEKWRGQKED